MNAPLLPVGKIIADVYEDGVSHLKVSKEHDTTGISVSSTVVYRINPRYRPGLTISNERLLDMSIGEVRNSKCHVMFGEGKAMADEILYLRAEVARLSKLINNEEDIP